jgi:hypothetical protein
MPYYTGHLTGGTLGEMTVLRKFWLLLKDILEDNNYQILRWRDFDDTTPGHSLSDDTSRGELWVKGIGLSGDEEIYWGMQPYYNRSSDYYNICHVTTIGYFPELPWFGQPTRYARSFALHNLELDYYLLCNQQRLCGVIRVDQNYQHFYIGKINQYSFPHQHPYPVVIIGTGAGDAGRYNGRTVKPYTDDTMSYIRLAGTSGAGVTWWPWAKGGWNTGGSPRVMPTTYDVNTKYMIVPVNNSYGELDGIYYISGYNATPEDTVTVGGKTFIMFPIAYLRSFADYIAFPTED